MPEGRFGWCLCLHSSVSCKLFSLTVGQNGHQLLSRAPHAPNPRCSRDGYGDHVLNRGHGGGTLFRKDGDVAAFLGQPGAATA